MSNFNATMTQEEGTDIASQLAVVSGKQSAENMEKLWGIVQTGMLEWHDHQLWRSHSTADSQESLKFKKDCWSVSAVVGRSECRL